MKYKNGLHAIIKTANYQYALQGSTVDFHYGYDPEDEVWHSIFLFSLPRKDQCFFKQFQTCEELGKAIDEIAFHCLSRIPFEVFNPHKVFS